MRIDPDCMLVYGRPVIMPAAGPAAGTTTLVPPPATAPGPARSMVSGDVAWAHGRRRRLTLAMGALPDHKRT